MLTFNGGVCVSAKPLFLCKQRRRSLSGRKRRSVNVVATRTSRLTSKAKRAPSIRSPNLRDPANNSVAINGTSAREFDGDVVGGDVARASVKTTCSTLIQRRSWNEATQYFVQYGGEGGEADATLGRELLKGLCNEGLFQLAWKTFNALPDRQSLPYSMYQKLISLALKAESYSTALKLFRGMRGAGYQPNKVTYCTLISGLLKSRRRGSPHVQIAYDLWKELEGSSEQLDAAALRVGCNACSASGKLEEAWGFPVAMRRLGFRPDTRLYNILMKGHCQRGNTESGLKVLKAMKGAGLQPDRVTYNTLIYGFVMNGDLSRAQACLGSARREGFTPDVRTYTSLMNGLVKEDNLREAMAVFEEMKAAGWTPNLVTFGTLIDGHVRENDMKGARALLEAISSHNLRPNRIVYNTLLRGYCSTSIVNGLPEVVNLLKEMTSNGLSPRVDTYNTILSSALRSRDPKSVRQIFEHMLSSGVTPDAVTFTILLKIYHKEGNLEGCERIFRKMVESPDSGVDIVALNALVACHALMGRMEDAEKLLDEANDFASDNGLPVPVEAFGSVIAGYANVNDMENAIKAFRRFYQLGGQPDVRMFEVLLKLCVRKGDRGVARKVIRAMEFSGMDIAKYSVWLEKSRGSLHRSSENQKDQNRDLERFKFWVGLPNEYYNADWP
ncbi:hypothetical protein BSKO_00423 [Bryopsis sp. KO-2023]|nr:hypothetical protein BSKO_00423 [Bryopsis sp. KO-2023]